jgi:hypothetical protein
MASSEKPHARVASSKVHTANRKNFLAALSVGGRAAAAAILRSGNSSSALGAAEIEISRRSQAVGGVHKCKKCAALCSFLTSAAEKGKTRRSALALSRR